MSNDAYTKYLGKICPYCKTEFIEGDEIVICSDCEMPHHKECFIENKGCTTFGCQGSMRSIEIVSTPVIDVQLLENDVKAKMESIEEAPVSDEEREKLYKDRIKASIYDEILSKLSLIRNNSNNINDLVIVNKLIAEFEKIIDFKDVKDKIALSVQKRNNIAEYLLRTTKLQIDCTDKISLVKVGLRRYDKIAYMTDLDVAPYKKEAEQRISIIERENTLKELEKVEKERKKQLELEKEQIENEKNKKRRVKLLIIASIVLVIVFIALMFVGNYFNTNKTYNNALNLMNEGNYEEAMSEFGKCKNFSNANEYYDYCDKMLHYLRGKYYVDIKDYQNALNEFRQAGEVEDTLEYINYCNEELNN